MSELYNYYGRMINRLCKAVMESDEESVDRLLADESFSEINDGVSPLYFINYIKPRDKALRIFRKILNNERFTNVNTVFYDGLYSSTLLHKLLYLEDPVFETCCVELINSPKYQLIDYPGNYGSNPSDLNTAVINGKKQAAKAIMDHPDFTKIDFSFGGPDFVRECQNLYNLNFYIKDENISDALMLIMAEYVQRSYYDSYNATDTNIVKRLTDAIQILTPYVREMSYYPPLSAACNDDRTDNDLIFEIINHPKFSGEMLSRHIKRIALDISDKEAYNYFKHNKKIEGWTPEFYGELAYYSINSGKVGLLRALIENDNISLSEQFYSYYKYFLENAIKASEKTSCFLYEREYPKHTGDEICKMIEEKYQKQLVRQQLDDTKFVELTEEDYSILKSGMRDFYNLVYKNSNAPSEQTEVDESLRSKLIYDKQANRTGPFFNTSDSQKVWRLFSEYQLFDEIRQSLSIGMKN